MRPLFRHLVIAFVLFTALWLPLGALSSPDTSVIPAAVVELLSPQSAAAAATDGCRVDHWYPSADGSKIYYRASMSCSTQTSYRMTLYLCGGVNGQGYCGHGVSTFTNFGQYLGVQTNCGIVYAGPWWFYNGVKLEHRNSFLNWDYTRWFFGPGAWLQGSCS